MNRLPPNEFASAARICLVANTPTYLYKHLSKDQTTQRIGHMATNEIINKLSFYGGEGANEEESSVALYVYLVALTFRPLTEYREFLDRFNPAARWIPELRGILMANGRANSIVTCSIEPQPVHSYPISGVNTVASVPPNRLIVSGK